MDMQQLKNLIYQGEKVDIECKKAESKVLTATYDSYSAFAIQRVAILFLVLRKTRTRRSQKRDLCYRVFKIQRSKEKTFGTLSMAIRSM